MRIRRSRRLFRDLEARYLSVSDDSLLDGLVAPVRARGSLTKDELIAVCRWKSPRALPLVRCNGDAEVEEATAWALASKQERSRVGGLLLLQGVSWPTASVMLHFFHTDPYPILDVRALWSLGMRGPSGYSFEFWWAYVRACRRLSKQLGLSMRSVDRALWQFSKERS